MDESHVAEVGNDGGPVIVGAQAGRPVDKEGLAQHKMAPGVDTAMRATTAAWAVFGAARRWFQTPNRIPAEEMAARIEAMVSPILFGPPQ